MFSSRATAPGSAVATDTTHGKVRILVLGDTGVGKTSIVNLICQDKVAPNPQSTIGCYIDVKLHEHNNRKYWVEFLEVGGKPKYESSRPFFYSQVNGVILVHDLTNKNSHTNLRKWTNELLAKTRQSLSGSSPSLSPFSSESKWKTDNFSNRPLHFSAEFSIVNSVNNNALSSSSEELLELELDNGTCLPVLIIGNKEDELQPKKQSIVDEAGGTSLNISALNSSTFLSGSPSFYKLNGFLNKVIYRTYSSSGSGSGSNSSNGTSLTGSSGRHSSFSSPYSPLSSLPASASSASAGGIDNSKSSYHRVPSMNAVRDKELEIQIDLDFKTD